MLSWSRGHASASRSENHVLIALINRNSSHSCHFLLSTSHQAKGSNITNAFFRVISYICSAEEVEEVKKVIQTSNKKKDPVVVETPNMLDDYEEAQEALFHAIENAEEKVMKVARKAEKAVEHAIHDEVDNIFHEMPHNEKIERVKKAKDIVKTGEKTVKKVERCWPENLKESLEECLAGDIE